MERVSIFWSASALAAALLAAPLSAVQVPAGTALQARLTTKVSTITAKPKDPVEAVVVAPGADRGGVCDTCRREAARYGR